ncbi:MAG TPA: isochorismatase family cysteine hydrolase [candidate division Zixibacteria bacterium]|nr:cysteine hydrolase [candidate division Zixibacteria bacterium]MDD4916780.1 cysteine hydrolase [candidate division Zixibacteria bacterium]MDM7974162.1 isochorismatase family cysteine hydrolase [candidate division Zixibacteria bacterium]HOD66119.1 isochorismatase family cysteine hydrolase [candidate division Zixibacteria bacterium]HOZ07481.1 isochorismatase family cysteine hydrolase [candidate division Zixibacteria bacterium]
MESNPRTGSLSEKTAAWLKHIEQVNRHPMTLNRGSSALLVVDMQNFFLDPNSAAFTCGGPPIIPNVILLIAAFRAQNRPVIYTKHVHHPSGHDAGIMAWWWKGMCLEGTPESEIHPDLAPAAGEKVIAKHRYSAFYGTDLEIVLRGLRITDLVITGVMTNLCCESTARDAYFRDYRVFFPADAAGSVSEELHLAALMGLAFGFAHVTRTADLLRDLTESRPARTEP